MFERCQWCGSSERMPRIHLCRACNRVRKNLFKTQEWVRQDGPMANRNRRLILERELAIAERMKWLCISDGKTLHGILHGEASSLHLENWFNQVAKRIARNSRLHYNTATPLGWTFTPSQRRVLSYMLWQIFHVSWQYNRRARAKALVSREKLRKRG